MKILILKSTYNILGSICIGNGLWMLVAASSWFYKMPIAAEDTGPLNEHFVHDLGLVFFLAGVGALWCARKPGYSLEVHLGVTIFIVGHALIHVVEILAGDLPSSHWLIDFPLVTLPAVLLLLITPVVFKLK